MTRKQHVHYRLELWPNACVAQGWRENDDAMRRDVTFEATGKTSTAELSGEDEVTALFNFLKLLADPLSLDKAIPVANPDVANEENLRRQRTHVVLQQGFAEPYIDTCAAGHCHAEDKGCWRELSSGSLLKLIYTLKTRARKRDAEAGKRPAFVPRSEPYHRRKSTKEKKAGAREPQVVPRPEVQAHADLLPF